MIETERILSRLNEKIRCRPYEFGDVKRILEHRSELAFKENVLTEEILDMTSQIVVDNQNMRHGVEILRKSGMFADKKGKTKITADMVRQASNDVYPTFREDLVNQLKDQEILSLYGVTLSLMDNSQPFTLVDSAFEQYQTICSKYSIEPQVKMSFRKYIRTLNQLKIIASKTVREEEAERGRHLEITLLDIPAITLEAFLKEILDRKYL